jgi:general secretion pathway protein G
MPRLLKQRGFTLLELLVVMVIIGLLAGLVGPRYFAQVGKSQTKAARVQIEALEQALEQYRIDVGHFPTVADGLAALTVAPAGEAAWAGPYLKKAVPKDPWGRPFIYQEPGSHAEVDISTFGKDGRVGGTGDNVDVTNW